MIRLKAEGELYNGWIMLTHLNQLIHFSISKSGATRYVPPEDGTTGGNMKYSSQKSLIKTASHITLQGIRVREVQNRELVKSHHEAAIAKVR